MITTSNSPEQHYLVFQALMPGDVLLCSARTAASTIIRRATGSDFSHAALYLGAGRYVESTPENGVHVVCLQPFKCEPQNSELGPRFLMHVPGGWQNIAVYRHRLVAEARGSKEKIKEIQASIYRAMLEERGFDYPPLSELLEAIPGLDQKPSLKKSLAELAERFQKHESVVPGKFCSAAVYAILQAAGYSAFEEERDPLQVTPGCLASSSGLLLTHAPDCLAVDDPSRTNNEDCLSELKRLQSQATEGNFEAGLRNMRLDIQELEDLAGALRETQDRVGRLVVNGSKGAP